MTAAPPRFEQVRHRMREIGVDVMLLSHGADLPWLTGYRAMPLERLTLLVLPAEGEPELLVPALEAARVPDPHGAFSVRPWMDTEDPIELAATSISRTDQAGGRSGLSVAISDRAWAVSLLGLQHRLATATWSPVSVVTGPLRARKDAHELAALRAAAAAADRVAAQLQAGDLALLGRSEADVSADIARRLVAEGHQRVNFAIVGSGPNGASPHHEPGPRTIAAGDVVVCDFGGTLAPAHDGADHTGVGYCSDITRTVVVGRPDPQILDYYAVLHAAQQAGFEAARAGVAAGDVDTACRRVIAEAGLGQWFIHRTGHGIGIDEHEDPYIVAGNTDVLLQGHVFSIEPGIYLPGCFGMRLEDIVVVGPDSPERLNTADRRLVELDA